MTVRGAACQRDGGTCVWSGAYFLRCVERNLDKWVPCPGNTPSGCEWDVMSLRCRLPWGSCVSQ